MMGGRRRFRSCLFLPMPVETGSVRSCFRALSARCLLARTRFASAPGASLPSGFWDHLYVRYVRRRRLGHFLLPDAEPPYRGTAAVDTTYPTRNPSINAGKTWTRLRRERRLPLAGRIRIRCRISSSKSVACRSSSRRGAWMDGAKASSAGENVQREAAAAEEGRRGYSRERLERLSSPRSGYTL